jgi:mannan endo-1,4-beta-mannosidase
MNMKKYPAAVLALTLAAVGIIVVINNSSRVEPVSPAATGPASGDPSAIEATRPLPEKSGGQPPPIVAQTVSIEAVDTTPVNPDATEDAKRILEYLGGLSSPENPQAVVGQNCYHGNEISAEREENGYGNLVAGLYEQTGKWVGMVGVDYEFMKVFTPAELTVANRVLIDHWKKGGLVTVNFSPVNPWVSTEADMGRYREPWNGPGSPEDLSRARLADLLDPAKPVHDEWRRKLDRIAAALSELQDAGVVVLWRPMQEMNGFWFWWGNDPEGYRKVYADMFDYFTRGKGLNNLLWVYSPSSEIPDTRTYPGDAYVDIVAPTAYNDALTVKNYELFASIGSPLKPFGLGEYGAKLDGPLAAEGTLDTLELINRIRDDYPRTAYWVAWHSYPDSHWSIISNLNYVALMNDPDVITLDKLNWKR